MEGSAHALHRGNTGPNSGVKRYEEIASSQPSPIEDLAINQLVLGASVFSTFFTGRATQTLRRMDK
jgi:hypothetical protein